MSHHLFLFTQKHPLSPVFKVLFVLLAAVSFGCTSFVRAGDDPDAFPYSCGLSCVSAVLAVAGKHISYEDLAGQANLDPCSYSFTSFSQIAFILNKYDCISIPVRLSNLDALSKLDGWGSAVIQTHTTNKIHFVVLIRHKNEYYTYDYPALKKVEKSSFVSELDGSPTGYVLIVPTSEREATKLRSQFSAPPAGDVVSDVQPTTAPTVVKPANESVEGAQIHLPKSSPISHSDYQSGIYTADISITNKSDLPLYIKSIQGTCTCFVDWSGPPIVEGLKTGRYSVRFDSEKFSKTNGSSVAITTSDKQLPVVQVTIKPVDVDEDRLLVYPLSLHPSVSVMNRSIDKSFVGYLNLVQPVSFASPPHASTDNQDFEVISSEPHLLDTGSRLLKKYRYEIRRSSNSLSTNNFNVKIVQSDKMNSEIILPVRFAR